MLFFYQLFKTIHHLSGVTHLVTFILNYSSYMVDDYPKISIDNNSNIITNYY